MQHDIDAKLLVDTLEQGGVALFPVDVGYAIVGNHEAAIERIYGAKNRSYDKACGMFSSWQMAQDLALLGDREFAMIDAIIHAHGLPLSVVTPFRSGAAFFDRLSTRTRELSSQGNTIDMLLNAGKLHDAVARQSYARGLPVLGSSANQSLSGSKYSLSDVESQVRAAADLVLDYGPTKYSHPAGMGSTIIELPSGKWIRKGIMFDEICDILSTQFDVDPRRITVTA